MNAKNIPAFPVSDEQADRIIEGVEIFSGLTKREYFAAKAMQALLSNQGLLEQMRGGDIMPNPSCLADKSVGYADCLLRELEKDKQ